MINIIQRKVVKFYLSLKSEKACRGTQYIFEIYRHVSGWNRRSKYGNLKFIIFSLWFIHANFACIEYWESAVTETGILGYCSKTFSMDTILWQYFSPLPVGFNLISISRGYSLQQCDFYLKCFITFQNCQYIKRREWICVFNHL